MGLCLPMRRMAMREARRPREGGVNSGELGAGIGRMVDKA
jgi:hypothetical protein